MVMDHMSSGKSFEPLTKSERRSVDRTLWNSAECTQKVPSLTILAIRVFQHAKQESQLACQAVFSRAGLANMGLGYRPEKRRKE
jgi:hypothetical protein